MILLKSDEENKKNTNTKQKAYCANCEIEIVPNSDPILSPIVSFTQFSGLSLHWKSAVRTEAFEFDQFRRTEKT